VIVAAVVVSFVYAGKTWCNYFCPVGLVEKLYTEPSRLAGSRDTNSQCMPCVACKKHCPDIDLEAGYWKELGEPPRRVAYFAWPGIVLGFYVYYYLYAGDWRFYFSGIWTYDGGQAGRWLDPGFTFLEAIPVVVAAPLTLLAFGGVSLGLFALGERIVRTLRARPEHTADRQKELDRRVRHGALVLAGFIGFNVFYCFGGQPTLRELPGWAVQGFSLLVVFASSAIFFRRLWRDESHHVQERFAQKILKRWEWGEAPPSDNLQDIYLLHTERSKQREARLRAYKETVREMVADGLVTRNELVLLDSLRAQLGVSDKDHEKALAELSDEERQLFDPAYQGSVEQRLQREQYERDLERIVVSAARAGRAPAPEHLESLRGEHGVSREEHTACLDTLMAADGPVVAVYREELALVARMAAAVAAASDPARGDEGSTSLAFVRWLCQWRGRTQLERTLSLLAAVRGGDAVREAGAPLASNAAEVRATAAKALGQRIDAELIDPLVAAAEGLAGAAPTRLEPAPFIAIAADTSPYLRAAIALLLSRFDDDGSRAAIVRATGDDQPLVREAAFRSLGSRGRLTRDLMSAALGDADPRVRQAAIRAVAGVSAEMPAVVDPALLAQTTQGVGSSDPAMYATLDSNARMESLTTIEKMMTLRNVPMFQELDPDDLEEVTGIAEERRFVRGDLVCREGEAGDDVFLVIRGSVRVYTGGGDRPERTLGELGPGACIGEMAVLDASPRSATVVATDKTRALVLRGDEFKNLMLARPAIAQRIIEDLVGRMRTLIAAQHG
jgi:hypothetical protein